MLVSDTSSALSSFEVAMFLYFWKFFLKLVTVLVDSSASFSAYSSSSSSSYSCTFGCEVVVNLGFKMEDRLAEYSPVRIGFLSDEATAASSASLVTISVVVRMRLKYLLVLDGRYRGMVDGLKVFTRSEVVSGASVVVEVLYLEGRIRGLYLRKGSAVAESSLSVVVGSVRFFKREANKFLRLFFFSDSKSSRFSVLEGDAVLSGEPVVVRL